MCVLNRFDDKIENKIKSGYNEGRKYFKKDDLNIFVLWFTNYTNLYY